MQRKLVLLALLFSAAFAIAAPASQVSGSSRETAAFTLYLPQIQGPSPLQWDPRLDERGAYLVPAQVESGQHYWRLVKAVWYAEHEKPFDGQHHIYVDTLDATGTRQTGVKIKITSLDGGTVYQTITTEQKPGDLYAANFPMYAIAPAYRAIPADGSPADAVGGMGLGDIARPNYSIHTSYGLVWQWSVAP
jgi:hypothetical protein